MISAIQLRQFATEKATTVDAIERDYVQSWLLYGIAKKNLPLVFKGGTCLKKIYFEDYRFSKDLDFTMLKEIDIEFLENVFEEICKNLREKTGIKFGIEKIEERERSITIKIVYQSIADKCEKRIEINLTKPQNEYISNNYVKKPVLHKPFDEIEQEFNAKILCYTLEEILAEKIRTLFERKRGGWPRDFYDVWYMLKRVEKIDWELFVKLLIEKLKVRNLSLDTEFLKARVKELEKHWKTSLEKVLPNIPDFKKVTSAVIHFIAMLKYLLESLNAIAETAIPRKFIVECIRKISLEWSNKNIFVIEAPTGYGKSLISMTISLYSINEELKSIVVFPLRTLLEDQYEKFSKLNIGNRLGKRYMHVAESRYLLKPVTLTTLDTFSMTMLGIPPEEFSKQYKGKTLGHYLFSWASVLLSNLVLDEAHLFADSSKSLNFLLALLNIACRFNQKVILMSATLPRSLKEAIKISLGNYREKVIFIDFMPEHDSNFVKERENKTYTIELLSLQNEDEKKFDKLLKLIEENKEKYSRIIVVFNTVNDAVEFYTLVKEKFKEFFGERNILLLHSRFSEADKERKNKILRELKAEEKYLIVSTQVIEAGVDISSNLFITEIAPANSLIQRLGRFLRYGEKEGKVIVWYEVDKNKKLNLSLDINKKPKNWICVDTKDSDVFETCKKLLKEYGIEENKIRKLSEWKEEVKVPVARPIYKVYDYVLTLRTLKLLEELRNVLNVHIPDATSNSDVGYRKLIDNVYTDSFEIQYEQIESFAYHFLHPENAPRDVIKHFIELGGSFVRDSSLFCVITEERITEFEGKDEKEATEKIRKYAIPVSSQFILSCIESEVITSYLYVNEKGVICRDEEIKIWDERSLIEFALRRNVLAFVVRGKYSEEYGLVVEK